jgi:hypothetical protein
MRHIIWHVTGQACHGVEVVLTQVREDHFHAMTRLTSDVPDDVPEKSMGIATEAVGGASKANACGPKVLAGRKKGGKPPQSSCKYSCLML